MTLQQLIYSITISESGSMNKAAESLYISQPTLTKAIKELESEIGFSIFIRSGKGVELTGDGRDFIIYAKQVCQQYEVLKDKFGTKNNRKKLIKAYSDKSPLIAALHIKDDIEIGMISENDKILVTNTKNIPLKTTKNSQGVQVMRFKKNVYLKTMCRATDMPVANYTDYRHYKIPSAGSTPKKEDAKFQQLTII